MKRRARLFSALVLALAFVTPTLGQAEAPAPRPKRLGVVGFYNPRLMYLKYQPLADYLSEKTGATWELLISADYDETVRRLCAGEVDLAYLGPLTYVKANSVCGARAVVRLQTGGKDSFRSYVMVRSDSPAKSLADLSGKRIGFGSPLSTSAHLVPFAMMVHADVFSDPRTTCINFGHHERAARACLIGEVDACGVRDIIGDRFLDRGLRVLATSEPIPNFPLVASPKTDATTIDRVVAALVDMPAQDARLRARMAAWDPELASGFVRAQGDEYERIRRLALEILGADFSRKSESDLACPAGIREP
ncbi:MAG: phosphate/phosphite/phosphonate ABC transporter substrate-binding protein [Acidobacteria bacterium]|nr:phosphate/phosphite/phosphonate ABC transporter substrate-binding protein [Acidobacteriota bacterium]